MSDLADFLRAYEPIAKAREKYDRYLIGLIGRELDEKIMLGAVTPETQAEIDRANAIAEALMEDDDQES